MVTPDSRWNIDPVPIRSGPLKPNQAATLAN